MTISSLEKHIKTIEEIERISNDLRISGKKIVTTNGSFDIMHSAHLSMLVRARGEGDALIVLLNSDKSIQNNKGPLRPIIPEQQRALMLAGLKPVDYVVIFPQADPLEYLARIKPDVHVKGGSYEPARVQKEEQLLRTWGGICKYFKLESGLSSTDIIRTILNRYGSSGKAP